MKPEELLGLIARRNTIRQERFVLTKSVTELEREMLRTHNEEQRLQAEEINLTKQIYQESLVLEFIDEWHWTANPEEAGEHRG